LTDSADLQQELLLIVDEMRSMSALGGYFAQNPYEAERADRILELAAKIAGLAESTSHDTVLAKFKDERFMRISPLIGVDAAVFTAKSEILLIRRRDNEHWAMPGGTVEIGQTLAEAVLKELWEEAGMRGRVRRLLAVFDGRLWGSHSRFHIIHPVFQVECGDLTPAPGMEAVDVRYFARDALPTPMHPGHGERVPRCFEMYDSGETYFDPAESITAHLPMHQRPEKRE
jgi:ADP-ribose pyrophosphatase YjhB (NUDIX family)